MSRGQVGWKLTSTSDVQESWKAYVQSDGADFRLVLLGLPDAHESSVKPKRKGRGMAGECGGSGRLNSQPAMQVAELVADHHPHMLRVDSDGNTELEEWERLIPDACDRLLYFQVRLAAESST